MITPYLVFILAAIFIAAAIPKIISSEEFMKTLYGIGLPIRLLRITAIAIPVAETLFVIMLLLPQTYVVGGICLLVLQLSFSVITVKAIVQKKKIKCNCFGNIMPGELGWAGLVRLIILIAITVYVVNGSDSIVYDQPVDETFYQIVSSLGVIALYAVILKMAKGWIEIRKGGAQDG